MWNVLLFGTAVPAEQFGSAARRDTKENARNSLSFKQLLWSSKPAGSYKTSSPRAMDNSIPCCRIFFLVRSRPQLTFLMLFTPVFRPAHVFIVWFSFKPYDKVPIVSLNLILAWQRSSCLFYTKHMLTSTQFFSSSIWLCNYVWRVIQTMLAYTCWKIWPTLHISLWVLIYSAFGRYVEILRGWGN